MNFRQSVERVLEQDTRLADRFYERFFERYPEVARHFEGLDMTTQSVMLTMTFVAIQQHPDLSNASRKYLRILGTKHHRKGVPRVLYAGFLDVLLETLQEFHGDDWSEDLAIEWRAAFGNATELMLEGYEERFRP